jgi:hypothetical protein
VGILVNYLYDEADIDSNHDAFVSEGVVAHSAAVDQLLQRREPSRERRA